MDSRRPRTSCTSRENRSRSSTTASCALTWLASSRSLTIPSSHNEARTVKTMKPATSAPRDEADRLAAGDPDQQRRCRRRARARRCGPAGARAPRSGSTTTVVTPAPRAGAGHAATATAKNATLAANSGTSSRHGSGWTAGKRRSIVTKAVKANAVTNQPAADDLGGGWGALFVVRRREQHGPVEAPQHHVQRLARVQADALDARELRPAAHAEVRSAAPNASSAWPARTPRSSRRRSRAAAGRRGSRSRRS